MSHSERNANDRHQQDGVEQCSAYLHSQQHGTQQNATHGNNRCCIPWSEGCHCSLARHNDATVFQANECDKESDTHRNGVSQVEGNAVDDGLAHLKDG